MPQSLKLPNTVELKRARSRVSSIAGYYKNYKKQAAKDLSGRVSDDRGVTLATARSNDYIRAHKEEIWDYRKTFTEEYLREFRAARGELHPQQEEGEENDQAPASDKNDKTAKKGSGPQYILDGEIVHANSSSDYAGGEEESGSDQSIVRESEDLQPDRVEDVVGGDMPQITDELVKYHAVMPKMLTFDLDRAFLGDTKAMLWDYFSITKPQQDGPEDLGQLERKQATGMPILSEVEKNDGRMQTERVGAAGGEDLSDAQKSGLSAISKYLYQRSAARSTRQNITFVEGLMFRPARERLLICYLVEKNKFDAPTEDDIIASQIYTPNITAFRKAVERSGFNLIGRMFLGSVHWSYLSKAAQIAMECRQKLIFMAANGMFSGRAKAPSDETMRLARLQEAGQGNGGQQPEEQEAQPVQDPVRENIQDEDEPIGDGQILREGAVNNLVNDSPVQKRDEDLAIAVKFGKAYISAWKNMGFKQEEQMSQDERQTMSTLSAAFQRAIEKLVKSDEAVRESGGGQAQGQADFNLDNVSNATGQGSMPGKSMGWDKAMDVKASGEKMNGMAQLGKAVLGGPGSVDKMRNMGAMFEAGNWSGGKNWNWANEDFSANASKSMAHQWNWRLKGIFPTVVTAGTGLFSTIGGIAALYAFLSGFKKAAVVKNGSAKDASEFIIKQLNLAVSSAKDALTDSTLWGKIFEGSIPANRLANLSTAIGVMGAASGAIGMILGSIQVHSGRMNRRRLDTIEGWVAGKVAAGEDMTDEQIRENRIIKMSSSASRRKADHDVHSGTVGTVGGALALVGGVLSMSVAGAPLGAALMLLSGGVALVNTIVGISRSKKRRNKIIDDYIDMDNIMTLVKRYDRHLEVKDDDLKSYIRKEAAGLMGFTGEKGFFDYICRRIASSLMEGLKKAMASVPREKRAEIAKDAKNKARQGSAGERELANYVLMIESFGPRLKFRTDGSVARPDAASLAKAISTV